MSGTYTIGCDACPACEVWWGRRDRLRAELREMGWYAPAHRSIILCPVCIQRAAAAAVKKAAL